MEPDEILHTYVCRLVQGSERTRLEREQEEGAGPIDVDDGAQDRFAGTEWQDTIGGREPYTNPNLIDDDAELTEDDDMSMNVSGPKSTAFTSSSPIALSTPAVLATAAASKAKKALVVKDTSEEKVAARKDASKVKVQVKERPTSVEPIASTSAAPLQSIASTSASSSASTSTATVKPSNPIIQASTSWPIALIRLEKLIQPISANRDSETSAKQIAELLGSYLLPPDSPPSEWYDRSNIPPRGRAVALQKLQSAHKLNNRFSEYFVNTPQGIETLFAWMAGALPGKTLKQQKVDDGVTGQEEDLKSTVLPLLRVLDFLPLEFEHLLKHNFGQRVQKLTVSPVKPVKELAKKLVARWTKVVEQRRLTIAGTNVVKTEVKADVKRKLDASDVAKKKLKLDTSIVIPRVSTAPAPKQNIIATPVVSPAIVQNGFGLSNRSGSASARVAGSILSVAKRDGKKRVTWPDDAKLAETRYFDQHDEVGNFMVAKIEGDAVEGTFFNEEIVEDVMEEEIAFYEPIAIQIKQSTEDDGDLTYVHIRPVLATTDESEAQERREQTMTEADLNDELLPPSAGESILSPGIASLEPPIRMQLPSVLSANVDICREISLIHAPPPEFETASLRAILDPQSLYPTAQSSSGPPSSHPFPPASQYGYNTPYEPSKRAVPLSPTRFKPDYPFEPSTSGSAQRAKAYRDARRVGTGFASSSSKTRSSDQQTCRFYGTSKGCRYGDKCRLRHSEH